MAIRAWLIGTTLAALFCAFGSPSTASGQDRAEFVVDRHSATEREAVGLPAFVAAAGEPVEAVIVELDGRPGFAWEQGAGSGQSGARQQAHRQAVRAEQDALLARAAAQGVPLLLRTTRFQDNDGRWRQTEYRFSYLFNGFVAYVGQSRRSALRALPGVRSVATPVRHDLKLDHSVNYVLGSQDTFAARRLAVYGATEELGPVGGAPVPPPGADGFEGQGINLAVIDSGLDYEHPIFGGSGIGTPSPQRPPNAPGAGDNRKVIYYNNLGGATTLDDHGHGTHVASTAGGYLVDGGTPAVLMTGAPQAVGPTPGGVAMHGVAPQARLLAWPVCIASGNCPGDVELGIEDAASPTTLIGSGDGGSIDTGVAKPVADVINLSLGGGANPASASARTANNAVLAGLMVVAAAGNSGPGAATLGSPCDGTGVICVASVLDPGSTAGSDVIAEGSTAPDPCANSNGGCLLPAPPAETGAASVANPLQPGERAGMRSYDMAGGGALPGGSVSAHYVYVNRGQLTIPGTVTGRIALLDSGTGTFATIVNPVAALNPVAILLSSDVTSATAVAVVNGVPTYTIAIEDANYLKGILRSNNEPPAHGAVSHLPMRVSSSVEPGAFTGLVSGFSSRGPNIHPNGNYRTIKPDLAAPGQGVMAAATPTGTPVLGISSPDGYQAASGTSMASPHAAGAAVLVRQRLRQMGLDSIDPSDPDHLARRFRVGMLARALLSNTASDLRTGLGGDDPDAPNPPYTVHDVGAGLIDIDAALRANAVMTSPTRVFDEGPNEYTPPGFGGTMPVPVNPDGSFDLPLPSASFANVPVIGANAIIDRLREVVIEDFSGLGGGLYSLSWTDDVLASHASVAIDFVAEDGVTPIGEVAVPTGGSARFFVRIGVDGAGGLPVGSLISWYVSAVHAGTGQRLRMPFLYRAVAFEAPPLAAPVDVVITEAAAATECAVDDDNRWGLAWTYEPPAGAPPLLGFRIERGRTYERIFADDASEPLVAGANSTWSGSAQWTSATNPNTSALSYFIPNLVEQDESLTQIQALAVPAGIGLSLEIDQNVRTEEGFDFALIEANRDGGPFQEVGRYTGRHDGRFGFNLSALAGGDVKVRLRMSSDLLLTDIGWYVNALELFTTDLAPYVLLAAPANALEGEAARRGGRFYYRVAAEHEVDGTPILGPPSAPVCVCVPGLAVADNPPDGTVFSDGFDLPFQCD